MGQVYREDSSTSPVGLFRSFPQVGDDDFFGFGSWGSIAKPNRRGRERVIESPGASSCDISPERGLPNPFQTPPTTPEQDKITVATDLCDLFEGCCDSTAGYQKALDIKGRLSLIDGAATLADYYEIAIDCKDLYVYENSATFRSAEQLVRLMLWYDLEQEEVTKAQIAADLTALGGRPETEGSVCIWCKTMRQHFPIPPMSKTDADKLRRARAETQGELRDRIAISLREKEKKVLLFLPKRDGDAIDADVSDDFEKEIFREGTKGYNPMYTANGWKPKEVPFTPDADFRDDLAHRLAKRIRANEGGSSA
jgi:hypothetical protein